MEVAICTRLPGVAKTPPSPATRETPPSPATRETPPSNGRHRKAIYGQGFAGPPFPYPFSTHVGLFHRNKRSGLSGWDWGWRTGILGGRPYPTPLRCLRSSLFLFKPPPKGHTGNFCWMFSADGGLRLCSGLALEESGSVSPQGISQSLPTPRSRICMARV